MNIVNSKTSWIILLFHLARQSKCADSINIGEETNFAPCEIKDQTLICNTYNFPPIYRDKTLNFLRPQRQKVVKLELLDLTIDRIPENYFQALADDLVSIKIVSVSAILLIHPAAFSGCTRLTILEIGCAVDSSITALNIDNIFSPLSSLEELILTNLNIRSLDADHLTPLTNLRALSIDTPLFNSISTEVFRNNKKITSLTFKGMKNFTDIMRTLESWPMSSKLMLSSINIYNCDVKKFPKLSLAIIGNLSQLFLAKNPIERIGLDDIRPLIKLEVLSLISTRLDRSAVAGLKLLTNLKDLKINDVTTLTDLPTEIEDMESLEIIDLSIPSLVSISISLPSSIRRVRASTLQAPIKIMSTFLSRCSQLRHLDLTSLPLDDIRFLLDNVAVFNSSLNSLCLDKTNLLKEQLFNFLSLLPNLEILFLNFAITGFLSELALINLQKLKVLKLSSNSLTYDSINTEGFQTIVGHLQEFDLSANHINSLPPCTFYSMPDISGLNLKDNTFLCDCNLLWLYETVKKRDIITGKLNFTCTTGKNDGKFFYQLNERDLQTCPTKAVDSCIPSRNVYYKLAFNVKYNSASSILMITNINGSDLRFMFDYVTITVKQLNSSFHYDFEKYELTRKSLNLSVVLKLSDIEVCLILSRNKFNYNYNWNCVLSSVEVAILESRWTIAIGLSVAIVTVVLIVVVLSVICCRKKREKKENDHDYMEASSTVYSEANDKNTDQYTYASNEPYSIEPSDGSSIPPLITSNQIPKFDPPERSESNNKIPDFGITSNSTRSKFRKRPQISKLFAKARSSSNIFDRHSMPDSQAESMLDLNPTEGITLPRQYSRRALPQTPAVDNFDLDPMNRPPPKPKLSHSDIRLLDNADKHLKYFTQYVSNHSLSTNESENHPNSGDSGIATPKVDVNLNGGSSVII